jgi:hypothetical protein
MLLIQYLSSYSSVAEDLNLLGSLFQINILGREATMNLSYSGHNIGWMQHHGHLTRIPCIKKFSKK